MDFLPSYVIYVGAFLAILYYYLTMNFNFWKDRNVPHEKPVILFGNFKAVAMRKQHMLTRITEIYNKHSNAPYIGLFMFGKPELMIKSQSLIRDVLIKDFHVFSDRKVSVDKKIDPIAFHALFFSKNPTWKAMRSKMSPVFTSGKIKLMSALIVDCAKNLNKCLDRNIGKPINSKKLFTRYTVDVISSCAFGIDANCLEDENSFILKTAKQLVDTDSFVRSFSIFSIFFFPMFVKLFKLTFADKEASNTLISIFEETLSKRKEQNIKRNDLIDLLNTLKSQTVKGEYTFDNGKMCSQAISFFGAGNETTNTILTFLTYEVCLQKDIQRLMREEIVEVLKKHQGQINYESVQDMKYMNTVLNETLRMYPLTITLERKASQDYTFNETGLTINKNTTILIPVAGIHFDPNNFTDPYVFNPERFNDENKNNIKPYTFMPFGEGPRICIGERFAIVTIKIALAHIFRDFELSFAEENPKRLEFNPSSFLLTPNENIMIKATRINNA